MNKDLSAELVLLHRRAETHLQVGEEMLRAAGGQLFAPDYLACAVLKRSSALLSGFSTLIESRNYICAAPLIRLQTDTACRFFAVSLVDHPHDFVMSILRGKQVNQFRDRHNCRMTDGHLVRILAKDFPGLDSIYSDASGYVHLSNKHLFEAFAPSEDDEKGLQMTIGPEDEYLPDEIRLQAVRAFRFATDVVLQLVRKWTERKEQIGQQGRENKRSKTDRPT